jgi:hypothetical protein
MNNNIKYYGDDLVALVWPRQSQAQVAAQQMTWEEASRSAWAMEREKANRVRVLIAVFDDIVVGAWSVTSADHWTEVPAGKTRAVNRSEFTTVEDDRLTYLVGGPTPRPRQRNPQTTFELRDLPGSEPLFGTAKPLAHGTVRLGNFALTVSAAGQAEVTMPTGGVLKVRASV